MIDWLIHCLTAARFTKVKYENVNALEIFSARFGITHCLLLLREGRWTPLVPRGWSEVSEGTDTLLWV